MNVYDCKGITPEYRVEIKNRFEILERDEEDEDANELWKKTKRATLKSKRFSKMLISFTAPRGQ